MGLRDGLQRLLRLHREGRETAGLLTKVLEQGGPSQELPLVPGEPEPVRERLRRLAQGAVEAGRRRGSETVLLKRFANRPTTYRPLQIATRARTRPPGRASTLARRVAGRAWPDTRAGPRRFR